MNNLSFFFTSVKKRVKNELTNGKKIPGIELKQKVPGNRVWKNEILAKRMLKKFLLQEEIYKKKLISPAQVEKKIKDKLPDTWNKLQGLIIRNKGKFIAELKKSK